MKIVYFQGGLGNQIFEYAFCLYLKQKFKTKIVGLSVLSKSHNGIEIVKWFQTDDISIIKIDNILWGRFLSFILRKNWRLFITTEEKISDKLNGFILKGWWQNKKYSDSVISQIKFKDVSLNKKNQDILSRIQGSHSVSIHVRRGDYLLPQFYSIYGNICTLDYYKKAIELIYAKIQNPCFFIFSDDVEWCKRNFEFLNPYYINWNHGKDSFFDMYLMSWCKSHIIANSSFSFWGARLSFFNGINIYPKKWYNNTFKDPDIFPEDWVSL